MGEEGAGGGVYSFVACPSRVNIDHASLPRRGGEGAERQIQKKAASLSLLSISYDVLGCGAVGRRWETESEETCAIFLFQHVYYVLLRCLFKWRRLPRLPVRAMLTNTLSSAAKTSATVVRPSRCELLTALCVRILYATSE